MGQSVIEINGTRYDASTGKVIVDAPEPTAPKAVPHTNGHNIDGIVGQQTKTPDALVPRPRSMAPRKHPVRDINMVHAPKTVRSKTLMRHVVKKPGAVPHAPKHHTATHPQLVHSPSYNATAHEAERLKHASATPKHAQVSRFAHPSVTPAKIEPKMVHNLHVTHPSVTQSQSHPKTATATVAPITPKGAESFVSSQLAKHTESTTPKKKPRLHKRALQQVAKNKFSSTVSGVLAVLLIGGFLVYQNMPTISLALANREAGISARMPKGVPSSFAIDRVVGTETGSVILSYTSRVDDRNFTLTQVKADTTVKTLEDTVARVSDNQYQTYQAGGITLFMSQGDRVDWMDGDMRYNITGSTGLSPDQLAQIATSL